LAAQGALDSALNDLDRASFADAKIYGDCSVVWYEKDHYDRALTDSNQVIKIESNFAAAYINRGMTLQRSGDFHIATANFDRAIEIDPNGFIVKQRALLNNGRISSLKRQPPVGAASDFSASRAGAVTSRTARSWRKDRNARKSSPRT
jgi:tetratricopeptide (TPR) repeat protein